MYKLFFRLIVVKVDRSKDCLEFFFFLLCIKLKEEFYRLWFKVCRKEFVNSFRDINSDKVFIYSSCRDISLLNSFLVILVILFL